MQTTDFDGADAVIAAWKQAGDVAEKVLEEKLCEAIASVEVLREQLAAVRRGRGCTVRSEVSPSYGGRVLAGSITSNLLELIKANPGLTYSEIGSRCEGIGLIRQKNYVQVLLSRLCRRGFIRAHGPRGRFRYFASTASESP